MAEAPNQRCTLLMATTALSPTSNPSPLFLVSFLLLLPSFLEGLNTNRETAMCPALEISLQCCTVAVQSGAHRTPEAVGLNSVERGEVKDVFIVVL